MEPVRGGNLVFLPEEAGKILDDLRAETGSECTNAGYALRFAAGFDGMEVVLSGMSNLEQVEDNIRTFSECDGDIRPLSEKEQEALGKVTDVFNAKGAIPCTSCRYCIEENQCPMDIRIPSIFGNLNGIILFNDTEEIDFYKNFTTKNHGKASDCIKCGMCEKVCPQHLEIRDLLEKAAETLEK